ncbi:MAG: phosphatidate cytidylyltransferase [Ferruginibacter sp.]
MALNIHIFKTRALTALIFVIIMLAGLFINVWGFIALCIIIMLGCFFEFIKITRKISDHKSFYYLPLGFFYIMMPMAMMVNLGITYEIYTNGPPFEKFTYSPLIPCAILFCIWINDTLAYLVGSFIGKTPLTKVSPKKTLEGTIGGAILCIMIITLSARYIPAASGIAWHHWLFISIICTVFGTFGDLLESKLKRMADVKDSGSFMPGHGGFLDRFDSMLIAIPFVWLYVRLLL